MAILRQDWLYIFFMSNIHDNEYIMAHFRSNVVMYTDSKGLYADRKVFILTSRKFVMFCEMIIYGGL